MAKAIAKPKQKSDPEFLVTPFTVVIDTREQAPYQFAEIKSDAVHGRKPVLVQTKRAGLSSGDYSLEGMESQIAVERKSLSDLFNTLGQGRRRFQNELERLSAFTFAAVVVEADWETILYNPPTQSRLNPKTVFRSVTAWEQRFINIHWRMCFNRPFAEVTTFRILERFWKNQASKTRST